MVVIELKTGDDNSSEFQKNSDEISHQHNHYVPIVYDIFP